jgi:hypothetical protein
MMSNCVRFRFGTASGNQTGDHGFRVRHIRRLRPGVTQKPTPVESLVIFKITYLLLCYRFEGVRSSRKWTSGGPCSKLGIRRSPFHRGPG